MAMRKWIWAVVAVLALAAGAGGVVWFSRPALVCVSEHGTCFHAADCPWIRGRSVMRLQAAEAKKRFRPC